MLGLLFMTGVGRAGIYPGDYLCLLCAISFALQIVLLSKYLSLGEEPILLTLVQMGVVAVGAGFFSLFTNSSYHLNLPTIGVLVYTGLLATAFAYLIQSYAQTFIPASRAGLIFAMEPVLGLFFLSDPGGKDEGFCHNWRDINSQRDAGLQAGTLPE